MQEECGVASKSQCHNGPTDTQSAESKMDPRFARPPVPLLENESSIHALQDPHPESGITEFNYKLIQQPDL